MNNDELFSGDWDPYTLLHQLAHDVVNLNDRLLRAEQYLQQVINQNANMAEHLADQSKELTEIYVALGKLLLDETE